MMPRKIKNTNITSPATQQLTRQQVRRGEAVPSASADGIPTIDFSYPTVGEEQELQDTSKIVGNTHSFAFATQELLTI
jgi:hypothetical protein